MTVSNCDRRRKEEEEQAKAKREAEAAQEKEALEQQKKIEQAAKPQKPATQNSEAAEAATPGSDKCYSCGKVVYLTERVVVDNKVHFPITTIYTEELSQGMFPL